MSIDCTIQEQTGEAFYQPRMCRASQVLFGVFPRLLAVLGWNANGPWMSEITIIWASFLHLCFHNPMWLGKWREGSHWKGKGIQIWKVIVDSERWFLGPRGGKWGTGRTYANPNKARARDSSASAPQWASWQTSRPAQLTNETSQKAPHLLIIPRILF